MSGDVFPSTLQSWIGQKLKEGSRSRGELNFYIMNVYAHPLKVYFSGCAERWLGDQDEVIAGFFADRLSRGEFLENWHQSGLRLRRWLMNAFSFYLAELRRRRQRDDARQALPAAQEARLESAEAVVDRAFVESVIREALRLTQRRCAAQGLSDHWGVFLQHFYAGRPYDQIAEDFGVSAARAAVMSRTAARKFRAELRELLCRDGATPGSVDDEIRTLLEVIES